MLVAVAILQVVQGAQAPRFPDFPKQDALSYSLDLKVDLRAPSLSGTVDYQIKALSELSSLRFHAKESKGWRVAFRDAGGTALASSSAVLTLAK